MKRIQTPDQKARAYQQQRRWYRDNKEWVNPKRYANRKLRMVTDPEFAARLREQNKQAMKRYGSGLL